MANVKINPQQAATLLEARTLSPYDREAVKKRVWQEVRTKYGIPTSIKFRVAIESPDNPLYCVLRNTHTNTPLTDGTPEPVATPVVVAASPAAAQAPAVDVAAKDAARKAAPVKAAKAPTKAVVKKSAPAKAAPAKKAAPTKKAADDFDSRSYPLDLRMTFGGKRVRLGTVNSAAEARKAVAKYKRQHA